MNFDPKLYYLIKNYNNSKIDAGGYKSIHSQLFRKVYSKNYKAELNKLEEAGLLSINDNYTVGLKTKTYNLKEGYSLYKNASKKEKEEAKMLLERAIKRGNSFKENWDADPVFCPTPNSYLEWTDVNIEKEALKEVLTNEANRKMFNRRDIFINSSHFKIERGDWEASNRTYTFLKSLKKDVKTHLKLKNSAGEWEGGVEVDLISAHPQILVHLLKSDRLINQERYEELLQKVVSKEFQQDLVESTNKIGLDCTRDKTDKEVFLLAWGTLVNHKFLDGTDHQIRAKTKLWAPVFDKLNSKYKEIYNYILNYQRDYADQEMRGLSPITLQAFLTRLEQKIIRRTEFLSLKEKNIFLLNEHDGLFVAKADCFYVCDVVNRVVEELFNVNVSFVDIIKCKLNKSNKPPSPFIVSPPSQLKSQSKKEIEDLRLERLNQTRKFACSPPPKPKITKLQQEEIEYQFKLDRLNGKIKPIEEYFNDL